MSVLILTHRNRLICCLCGLIISVVTFEYICIYIRGIMKTIAPLLLFCVCVFSADVFAESVDPHKLASYRTEFSDKVHKFAMRNRFHVGNINRDKFSHCYLTVKIDTTILASGKVKNVVVKKSSTVPMVDKYFKYVIEQSAPFKPLKSYFGSGIKQIVVTENFKLDLYQHYKKKSRKSCN